MKSLFLVIAGLAATTFAKTDLEGCTSSETVVYGGASLIFWDPSNGEICSFLDCGGGRAPPKTTVPGCAGYEGTATYTPDFMPGWGSTATTASGSFSTGSSASAESASETKTSASSAVTSKAVLPSGTATGTGGLSGYVSSLSTANNVTSATLTSSGVPAEASGAAGKMGAREGIVGVLAGVVGLAAML